MKHTTQVKAVKTRRRHEGSCTACRFQVYAPLTEEGRRQALAECRLHEKMRNRR